MSGIVSRYVVFRERVSSSLRGSLKGTTRPRTWVGTHETNPPDPVDGWYPGKDTRPNDTSPPSTKGFSSLCSIFSHTGGYGLY